MIKGAGKGNGYYGGGKGKGMYNIDPAPANPLWQLQAKENNTWEDSGTFSLFHLRGSDQGGDGWTSVCRRPRSGEPMKVNLMDLVKKQKTKANHNRFEALQEEQTDDEVVNEKGVINDKVPAVPPAVFPRMKGQEDAL